MLRQANILIALCVLAWLPNCSKPIPNFESEGDRAVVRAGGGYESVAECLYEWLSRKKPAYKFKHGRGIARELRRRSSPHLREADVTGLIFGVPIFVVNLRPGLAGQTNAEIISAPNPSPYTSTEVIDILTTGIEECGDGAR